MYPAWVIVALIAVSLVIVGPFLNYTVPERWLDWLESPLGSLVLTAVLYFLTTLVVIAPMAIVRRLGVRQLLQRLGMAARFRLVMVPWSLLAWGLYFGASLMVMLVLSLLNISGVDLSQNQEIGFDNLTHGYEYVAAFVALVVLAPLFEEILFRGFLYGRLRRHAGFFLSALLTSAAFAFVHFQLNVGIDVFVLSLFLCFLREKFDSIWPGVMVHALKNGIAYIALFILPLYGLNLIQ